MPYIQNALKLIIEITFSFYELMVVLRFVFQLCRVNFYNPISSMVVNLTNPPLNVFRRVIPSLFGIDLACVVLAIATASTRYGLLLIFETGDLQISAILLLGLATTINIALWVFIIAVIISAILSWFRASQGHPAINIVNVISASVLQPFRRLIPSVSGIDISPIFAILSLRVLQFLTVHPLEDIAISLLI